MEPEADRERKHTRRLRGEKGKCLRLWDRTRMQIRHMYICTNRVRVRACVGISTRDAICATGRVYVVAWVETGRIKGTGSAWEVRQCDRGYARACTGVFPGEAWLVAIGERMAKVSGKGESTRAVSWGWKVGKKAAESVSR